MESGISKANMIGWLLTITLSVFGAWGAMSSRVYAVEKEIELLKLEMKSTEEFRKQQASDINEIKLMFYNIEKTMVEMNGRMALKEDKKWK